MVATQSNKLITPHNCMYFVNASLFRIFMIWAFVIADLSSMYLSLRFLTNCAYDKKRLVYARKIKDIAENKKVGVMSVSASMLVRTSRYEFDRFVYDYVLQILLFQGIQPFLLPC